MKRVTAVLFVLCIVGIHAFVKRDTEPATTENYLANLEKQMEDIKKQFGEKLSSAFNPDQLKNGFSEIVDNLKNAFESATKNEPARQP